MKWDAGGGSVASTRDTYLIYRWEIKRTGRLSEDGRWWMLQNKDELDASVEVLVGCRFGRSCLVLCEVTSPACFIEWRPELVVPAVGQRFAR